MLNTKQIDRTEAHVEKKNHLKINRPGDRIYSAEADSGLSKQLLGNFQTEQSCHCNFSRLIKKIRSSCPEVFCKKGVPKNFAKFTGKYLCQSLFLNKVAGAAGNFI